MPPDHLTASAGYFLPVTLRIPGVRIGCLRPPETFAKLRSGDGLWLLRCWPDEIVAQWVTQRVLAVSEYHQAAESNGCRCGEMADAQDLKIYFQ